MIRFLLSKSFFAHQPFINFPMPAHLNESKIFRTSQVGIGAFCLAATLMIKEEIIGGLCCKPSNDQIMCPPRKTSLNT